MDAGPATLIDILSADKKYIVPVFQRFYSWKEDNWKTLWTDLQLLVYEPDQNYDHFIGPMIVNPRAVPHDITRFFVIDGQQRLITLSILLCSLRDIATDNDLHDLASLIQELLLFRTSRGDTILRLEPRFADREPFRRVIEGSVSSQDSEETIVRAYQHFRSEIEADLELHDEDVFAYLNELFTAIKKRLKIVSITLEDKDDPTKIFESMNFKNEKLLNADLIRNFAMMQLPIEKQDEFGNTQWESFEKRFADEGSSRPNSEELEDFYYRYLIAQTDYFAKGKVYSTFTDFASEKIVGQNDHELLDSLGKLVSSMKRFGRYYRAIVHPNLERDDELKAAFKRFNKLDVVTALPLLMDWYDRFDNNSRVDSIDKESFLSMLDALESFVIRRSILGERTRGYGSDFAQAKKSQNLGELHDYFYQRGWPSDKSIKEALVDFSLYSKERKKTRLILEQLERSFGHKEQVDIEDPNIISIEHIMPQTERIPDAWKQMLGEKAEEVHEMYRHTLGNLTLTGYNRELSKRSFDEKKNIYANQANGSRLALNKSVLRHDKWTINEILQRTEELSLRLIDIWPRPTLSDTI